MGTTQAGGLYYVAGGKAVDANGNEIKDAPKRPKDTPPPTAGAALTPAQEMGLAIAQALRGDIKPPAPTPGDDTEDDGGVKFASPAASDAANEAGLIDSDFAGRTGSGADGKWTAADVRALADEKGV